MAWAVWKSSTIVASALVAAALLAAAAHAEGCAAPASAMSQVEMYFGSSVKGLPFVTEEAWSQFLASEVTPKFPDGLTVFDAHGQWRSDDGKIYREETHVLLASIRPTPRLKVRSRRSATPTSSNSSRKVCPCGSTRPSAPPFDCLGGGLDHSAFRWT